MQLRKNSSRGSNGTLANFCYEGQGAFPSRFAGVSSKEMNVQMEHLKEFAYRVTPEQRAAVAGHGPLLVWFTGLSGSGKSTLADALECHLLGKKMHAFHLDGDAIRSGLNSDLGFSPEDRNENIRRVGEVAALMLDAGLIVIAAFVSPMKAQREAIRKRVGGYRMLEVYVNTPQEVCEARDVKGFYARARKGEIAEFTGVSAPYEAPESPDVIIDTSVQTIEEAIQSITFACATKGITLL